MSKCCTHVLDARAPDLVEKVKKITNGVGADVVYDSVGKLTWEKSLSFLKPRGLAVFYGNASGPVPPIDPLILSSKGSLFVTRPTVYHYTSTPEELQQRGSDLYKWYEQGLLSVRIDKEYELSEVDAALNHLESGKSKGKILLKVASDSKQSKL